MTLTPGTRLGAYEIVAAIGAGGMGEVYKARDTRLDRTVAIKVLPPSVVTDDDRLRRFEQEARAASALNHPNILTVFDVGSHAGSPFVVTEMLEGQPLSARMAGVPLAPRKAIEYATQMAHGLAAAHERGIVHRDLKPDNVFVTHDGRIKILDFGLAKLIEPRSGVAGLTAAPTLRPNTAAGVVLGTVGYMSPEQVRGLPADHRADIFAFGAILYEMLAGRRAFQGDSAVDMMSAILREEPAELSQIGRSVPPGLERIVRHCLEKSPEERFQSARDLAFDLQNLSTDSSSTRPAGATTMRRRLAPTAAAAIGLAAIAAFGAIVLLRWPSAAAIQFQQLTFRRGVILNARFAPDDKTIVYGLTGRLDPYEVLLARLDNTQSQSMGFPGADVLAISRRGELALAVDRHFIGAFVNTGTLARASLTGGAARPVLDDVQTADWGPGGDALAVVHDVGGKATLEYPQNRVLYQTAGWISHARVSSTGEGVAFLDHAVRGDDSGVVATVDARGQVERLTPSFASIQGLAWAPSGEIWFTAATRGGRRELFAVRPGKRARLVYNAPGVLTLHDIAPDGRVLLSRDEAQVGLRIRESGRDERDLSWLDWSLLMDLSVDGRTVLFDETGEGGGPDYSVYVRKADGSPPVLLGEGAAATLSPDGRWVAAIRLSTGRITLLPIGVGQARELDADPVRYQRLRFFPDGKRLLVAAYVPQHGVRLYVKDLDRAGLRSVTPENMSSIGYEIAPDGRLIAAATTDGVVSLYPVDGGPARVVPGTRGTPIRWEVSGRALFVLVRDARKVTVQRVTLDTGERETVVDFGPPVMSGVQNARITPDGRTYAYSYGEVQSTLFLVTGLK